MEGALLAAMACGGWGSRRLLVDLEAVRDSVMCLPSIVRTDAGDRWEVRLRGFALARAGVSIHPRIGHELFRALLQRPGEKTLRAYSRPVSLARFDRLVNGLSRSMDDHLRGRVGHPRIPGYDRAHAPLDQAHRADLGSHGSKAVRSRTRGWNMRAAVRLARVILPGATKFDGCFHSNSTTPAATLTFNDAMPDAWPVRPSRVSPAMGIRTRKSQRLATCSCKPRPSPPRTMAEGFVNSTRSYVSETAFVQTVNPVAVFPSAVPAPGVLTTRTTEDTPALRRPCAPRFRSVHGAALRNHHGGRTSGMRGSQRPRRGYEDPRRRPAPRATLRPPWSRRA